MESDMGNYYQVLGLRQTAATQDVEAAFQTMHALYGPGGERPDQDLYKLVRRAYDVLRDPQRRHDFDALLAEVQPSIALDVRLSAQELELVDEPQMVYLLVELRPNDGEHLSTAPLNLCLVIDRSTSMQGPRIEQVKHALKLLLPRLSAGDTLSLVSFSDRAEVIAAAAPVAEMPDLQEKISALRPSGGTEIYHGLLAGLKQLQKTPLHATNSQMILLTDGRTYGDEEACLQLVQEMAQQGIALHAFGLGDDWDDTFLDALVRPSGGLADYLETPGDIVIALRERLQSLGRTHARQLALRVQWPRSVDLQTGFRLTPYARALDITGEKLLLGDLEEGSPLSLLLSFLVKPQPIETRIRIPLLISAELPEGRIQTLRHQVELLITADPSPYKPPPQIIRAARLMTLYDLSDRAWQEAESGDIAQAVERMRRFSTRLLEAGEPALAAQAEIEAQQIARTGRLSAAGRKSLKYGTRALSRKALQ